MTISKGRNRCLFLGLADSAFGADLLEFLENRGDSELRTDRALVRKIGQEVAGGLPYFLFHVHRFPQNLLHHRSQTLPDRLGCQVAEKDWQTLLKQGQDLEEVFKNWILQALGDKLDESFEVDFHRQVLSVDLSCHGVALRGV